MTRGKYAARATGRREASEIEASEAAYRRQIVRLTQERDEARTKLADLEKKSQQEIRRLTALVNEGTSDQVAALRIRANKLRTERDRAVHDATQGKLAYLRVGRNVVAHLMADDGLSFTEATKNFAAWLGKADLPPDEVDDELERAGAGADAVTRTAFNTEWDFLNEIRVPAIFATRAKP